MIDPRVSDLMDKRSDVHLTWGRAQAGLDLAEYNAKMGGRFSWGRLRAQGRRGESDVRPLF